MVWLLGVAVLIIWWTGVCFEWDLHTEPVPRIGDGPDHPPTMHKTSRTFLFCLVWPARAVFWVLCVCLYIVRQVFKPFTDWKNYKR